MIDREAQHAAEGRPARIIVKLNGLTDNEIIQRLYRASQAGVRIDLIVRGIGCLRPGITGVSDRISVRSIVGRFLEHSRVLWLENGGDPAAFIGSADFMERNLDRRVEVLCPVLDSSLRGYLRDTVLEAYLRDTDQAWTLEASGQYAPPIGRDAADPLSAQATLLLRHTIDYQRD
jgi:polyphosphate kinase